MAGLIVGIAGLGISAGTTAASFIQAGQEKRKQRQYEADADKAMQEARRQLQINYAKQMSIKKEPYNLERLGVRAAGQGIINAATESDRGAAAAAGQVMMATQAGEADITNRQTDELYNIENAILEEESRLRDINVDLDMQEVEGNMAAAADARMLSQQATQAGIEGVASTAQAGLSMVPLYQENKNATNAAIAKAQAADPTYLAGYNPATATGRQYRQMKRANPLYAANSNYQAALAGLPTESTLVKMNPALPRTASEASMQPIGAPNVFDIVNNPSSGWSQPRPNKPIILTPQEQIEYNRMMRTPKIAKSLSETFLSY